MGERLTTPKRMRAQLATRSAEEIRFLHFQEYRADPVISAEHLNVHVSYRKLQDNQGYLSGALRRREDRVWEIMVNDNHPEKRQRFTIAHELGHYILHRHMQSTFLDSSKDRVGPSPVIEREATLFASCFLMPDVFVRKLVSKAREEDLLLDDSIVLKIAEQFGVSMTAMNHRIHALKLFEPLDY